MAARTIGRRRSLNAMALAVGAVLLGLVALVAAVIGTPGERVSSMWVGAELRADGTARITEVVDYVFTEERHGIYREIPGAEAVDSASVHVTMDGGPVEFDVGDRPGTTRIQIGDPLATVTGAHRFRIEYVLPEVGDPDLLAWDAVGLDWEVPVERAEVHVTAPLELDDPTCSRGVSGSEDRCAAEHPSPGRIDTVVNDLDVGEGLTLYAEILTDTPTDAAPLPEAPTGAATVIKAGDSVLTAGLLAAGAALLAAAVIALAFRVLGRPRVESIDGMARRRDLGRVDVEPSYRPPAELGPAQAGVLYTDKVRAEHQAAWILGAALDGHVSVKGSKAKPSIRLLPGNRDVDRPTGEILGALFALNTTVKLGKYSKTFATAWKLIRTELRKWRAGGDGLWQPWGTPVRRVAMGVGALSAVAGTVVMTVAATGVTEAGSGWRNPLVAAAAAVGAGLAAFICAWELRMRTPRGARLWCETEAYRRYLATLTPSAWTEGNGEVITAWAVALGQTASVLAASAKATTGKSSPGYQPEPAVFLQTSASHSTSPPSSGGSGSSGSSGYSGGGDSGGSGGGDGGGGGGSW